MWLNNAIGFLVMCLTLARRIPKGSTSVIGFYVFRWPWPWLFRSIGFSGITLGLRIFSIHAGKFNQAAWLAEELNHVDQQRLHGAMFFPRYLWQWVAAGFRYSLIPFEVAAKKTWRVVRKALGR